MLDTRRATPDEIEAVDIATPAARLAEQRSNIMNRVVTIPVHIGCWPTHWILDTVIVTEANQHHIIAELQTTLQILNRKLSFWKTYSVHSSKISVGLAAYLQSIQSEINTLTNTLLFTPTPFNTSIRISLAGLIFLGDVGTASSRYIKNKYKKLILITQQSLKALGDLTPPKHTTESITDHNSHLLMIPKASICCPKIKIFVRDHNRFFAIQPRKSLSEQNLEAPNLNSMNLEQAIKKLQDSANENTTNYLFLNAIANNVEFVVHALAVFIEVIRQAINSAENHTETTNNAFNGTIDFIQYTLVFIGLALAVLAHQARDASKANRNLANAQLAGFDEHPSPSLHR